MLQRTIFIVLSWIYLVFLFGLVLNRLYVRFLRRSESRALSNWSDGLVVFAWLLDALLNACNTYMYSKGVMKNVYHLDDKERSLFGRIYYIGNIIYYVPLYCVKGAILCFLLVVTASSPTSSHIRPGIWVGIAFCLLGVIFTVLSFTFACPPIGPGWEFEYGVPTLTITVSICWHMFTDVYVYTLPFCLLAKLKGVSRSEKYATWSMIGAGFIPVLLAVPTVASNLVPALGQPVMWQFWVCLHEQTTALVVVCLPAVRVTMKQVLQRWSQGSDRSLSRRMRRGELPTREVAGTIATSASSSEMVDVKAGKGSSVLC